MRIEHNGTEWCGTFQHMLRTLVTDVASDGPFEATLTWCGEEGEPLSATVEVVGMEGGELTLRLAFPTYQTVSVDPERVLALEVM